MNVSPLNLKASNLKQRHSRATTFVAQGRRRQDALDQVDDANISIIIFFVVNEWKLGRLLASSKDKPAKKSLYLPCQPLSALIFLLSETICSI